MDSLITNLPEETPKADINPKIEEVEKKYYLSIRTESSMQETGQKMGETYGQLMKFAKGLFVWYYSETYQ